MKLIIFVGFNLSLFMLTAMLQNVKLNKSMQIFHSNTNFFSSHTSIQFKMQIFPPAKPQFSVKATSCLPNLTTLILSDDESMYK